MSIIINYLLLSLVIIVFNIPFGYLRQGTRKFSFYWFLYIHLPVPLVVMMRGAFDVDLSLSTAPLLFGSFFLGQFIGKKLKSNPVMVRWLGIKLIEYSKPVKVMLQFGV